MNCPNCGVPNRETSRFCSKCGATLMPSAEPQVTDAPSSGYQSVFQQPGVSPPPVPQYTPQYGGGVDWRTQGADKKLPAAICGILLGGFGIHKFILGYNTEGIIMLLVTVLTCGIGAMVTGVIGLIEGILYLTKSDEEFVRTYIQNKKGWF